MVRKLGSQHAHLDLIAFRLRERSTSLFGSCESAIRSGRRERALVYASELAEVKKLIHMVNHAQLAVEQVILRLETMREMESITRDLRSTLDVTQKVAKQLTVVMPKVSSEMSRLNNVITGMLDTTVVSSALPVTPVAVKDEEAEEILRETASIIKEDLKAKIPEPPVDIAARMLGSSEKIEVAILASSCSEETRQVERPVESYVSYEETDSRHSSFATQRSSSIEKWVLAYARKNSGEVDVSRCASELNVLSKDVLEALEVLNAHGKIKIEP